MGTSVQQLVLRKKTKRKHKCDGCDSLKKTRGKHGRLTASVLVAVVAAVVVPVTLPLRWDARALAERADRACEVVPPARALGAALDTCTHTHTHVERVKSQGIFHFRRNISVIFLWLTEASLPVELRRCSPPGATRWRCHNLCALVCAHSSFSFFFFLSDGAINMPDDNKDGPR